MVLILGQGQVFGQIQATCFCADSLDLPAEYAIKYCKPLALKTGELLYYEYNCDSLWLTMERAGKKLTLFKANSTNYQNSYKKPYLLELELEKYILFTQYCNPACTHYLVEKATGKIAETFTGLVFGDRKEDASYNLLISIEDEKPKALILYHTDTNQKEDFKTKVIKTPSVYPQHAFDRKDYKIEKNRLILAYQNVKLRTKYIKVPLKHSK